MPVNWADIRKAHFFKQQPFVGGSREMGGRVFGGLHGFFHDPAADRHPGDHALCRIFAGLIQGFHAKFRQIGCQRPDILGDRHFVVV